MENQLVDERTINLAKLTGEELQVELEELREKRGRFQKIEIEAPEDITFQDGRYLKVVEGFTPGAAKNIISISKKKLRVYSVTGDSIRLINCSEVPREAGEVIFSKEFIFYQNLIFNKWGPSIQFIAGKSNQSLVMKINSTTGEILETKKLTFSRIEEPQQVEQFSTLPTPKNSRIDSYLNFKIKKGSKNIKTAFLRERNHQARKWIDLMKMVKIRHQKEKNRFSCQKQAQIPQEYSQIFRYSSIQKNQIFESESMGASMISFLSDSVVHLVILSFDQRKVLWTRSINFLDFLNFDKIYQILQAVYNDSNDQEDGDEGTTEPEQLTLTAIRFKYKKVVFDSKTNSLIIDFMANQIEVFVKLNQVLSEKNLKKNNDFFIFKNQQRAESLVGKFSDDKILCYDTKTPKSTLIRPLAFLGPKDMKVSRVKGFEESEDFTAMNGVDAHSPVTRIGLCEGRMLIVTYINAFIYDYEEGRVLAKHRHSLRERDYPFVAQMDDIFAYRSNRRFNFIRTEVSDSGRLEVKETKTIFLNDFIPNMSERVINETFKFFKLDNGNYLLITSVILKDEFSESLIIPSPELFSLEIAPETLKVVKIRSRANIAVSRRPPSKINCSYTHLVSGLLVFPYGRYREQKNQPGRRKNSRNQLVEYRRIALASLDFEILDVCKLSKLSIYSPIGTICGNRLISMGAMNTIYLHEVITKYRKLVLLRRLNFVSGSLERYPQRFVSPNSFCCYASIHPPQNEEERDNSHREQEPSVRSVVLNFDPNLNLINHLHHQGLGNQKLIFSATKQKMLLYTTFPHEEENYRLRLYLVDLKRRGVELVHQTITSHLSPTYQIDPFGNAYAIEMLDESMLVIKLT